MDIFPDQEHDEISKLIPFQTKNTMELLNGYLSRLGTRWKRYKLISLQTRIRMVLLN